MSTTAAIPAAPRSPLERLLGLFADVRPGEGATVALLMLNVFTLLCCYYIIKPVREALILGGESAEVKSYASAAMAVVLVALVPAYGKLASRVDRMRLIGVVSSIFVANLVIFYLLGRLGVPHLGIAFFVWVGIFNLMIIAQFWSFANDVYSREEGERLFGLVAFGASLGAILGGRAANLLFHTLGAYNLLLLAAVLLAASVLLTAAVNRIESRAHDARSRDAAVAPLGREGGFSLVLSNRYLLYIALLALVLNIVNTNGEYILGKTLSEAADRLIAGGATGGLAPAEFKRDFIGTYYAGFFTWVNTVGAVVQLFVVSRLMQKVGVRAVLFVLPLIALGGYTLLLMAPVIGYIRAVKIAENSTEYSLQNTARHALFLPTSREAKYKAKSAIDTFFVRAGDVLSAGAVFAVTTLALTTRTIAAINLVLVLVWILLVLAIGRQHVKLTGAGKSAKP
jgi:AAA family ATP:ADP antiporter